MPSHHLSPIAEEDQSKTEDAKLVEVLPEERIASARCGSTGSAEFCQCRCWPESPAGEGCPAQEGFNRMGKVALQPNGLTAPHDKLPALFGHRL